MSRATNARMQTFVTIEGPTPSEMESISPPAKIASGITHTLNGRRARRHARRMSAA